MTITMPPRYAALLAVLSVCLCPAAQAQTVDLAAAKKQFLTSCGTCHVAEPGGKHRQGPNLYNVVGTKAGAIADFKFSPALAASGLILDEATLDKWIENPKALVPGTNMSYRQRDAAKRALVIGFLKSLQPPAAAQ
jgi:cytochrome c